MLSTILPLKTPSPGEVNLLQTEKAHVTQQVENSFVFLRGKPWFQTGAWEFFLGLLPKTASPSEASARSPAAPNLGEGPRGLANLGPCSEGLFAHWLSGWPKKSNQTVCLPLKWSSQEV